MILLDKRETINLYSLSSLYEIHTVKEKIKLFEKKYRRSFKEFEIDVKKGEENFEHWDDYMEWKAYKKTYNTLLKKKKQISNGDYQIS